jgi:hypothetical protein
MRRIALLATIVGVLGVAVISGVPAFGADNGTVTATVSVQDVPCMTVTSSGIDYGAKVFSGASPVQATGTITSIGTCSSAAQTVWVKGASATATGVTWTLVAGLACPTTNQYVHEVDNPNSPASFVPLTNTNQNFGTFNAQPHSIPNIPTRLTMPCTGSAGAGQTISTQILFSATVS